MKSAGAKPEPRRWTAKELEAYTAQAIADGRHSEKFLTVCDGCHEWVDSILHVTIDKKRLCLKCYVKQFNITL